MGLFSSIFGGGGGGGSGKVTKVPVPDPQEQLRTEAQFNRVDQFTPFGNLTFGGPDRNQLRFDLDPQDQRILAGNRRLALGGVGRAQTALNRLPIDSKEAQAAILERIAPQMDIAGRDLRNSLEQSGNPAGFGGRFSEGAFNELSLLNQRENDAKLAALLGAEQFRGSQIANIGALGSLGGSGIQGFNFQGASPVNAAQAFANEQQAHATNAGIGQFNAGVSNQRRSSSLGGLFDLGSAAFGLFGG